MNDICNLACSILKFYGIAPRNDSLAMADALLLNKPKKLVLLLLDGMGYHNIEEQLGKDSFFFKNIVHKYNSVFPATTVAATTSVQSGLYPSQHAWLGWTNYYAEIDRSVVVFLNCDAQTEAPIEGAHVASSLCPYTPLVQAIRDAGTKARSVGPHSEIFADSFDDVLHETSKLLSKDERQFIYIYWPYPDSAMHAFGPDSGEVKQVMEDLQARLMEYAKTLDEDTLFLITADHGQIRAKRHLLEDYPDITACLTRLPTVESRTQNFFVKEDMHARFVQAFSKHFSPDYTLYSKEEVLQKELFGPKQGQHPHFEGMLGDFLAVANTETTLYITKKEADICIGVHAGNMQKEKEIPLIVLKHGKA